MKNENNFLPPPGIKLQIVQRIAYSLYRLQTYSNSTVTKLNLNLSDPLLHGYKSGFGENKHNHTCNKIVL